MNPFDIAAIDHRRCGDRILPGSFMVCGPRPCTVTIVHRSPGAAVFEEELHRKGRHLAAQLSEAMAKVVSGPSGAIVLRGP